MNLNRFNLIAYCLMACWSTAGFANDLTRQRLQPNIILINLDDADYRMFSPDLLKLYPHIQRLAERSISFTNLHVTTPFCGPSRASLFRGQYAHRTGVRVNIPESPLSLGFKGGYSEFLRQGHERNELGVWLKQAGYRTMMIGKYHHNGFDFRIPPGWDDFYMSNGGRYQGTYRFTTKDNPQGSNSRNPDNVYRTDQEADDAIRLIREHFSKAESSEFDTERSSRRGVNATAGIEDLNQPNSANPQPFFLYLAPLAPHRPVGRDFTNMVDKKKYGDWQPDLRIPATPEFDEAQMSDKPLHRQSPPYSNEELLSLQSEYVSRARAVKSVDDMVGRVLDVVKECELTESTYIFFTSDNGYQLGQHRLHNKLDPYQMCTNVPLYVSGPGIKPNQTANHLLAHIDLCPTILDLAKIDIPPLVDGKSFAPLLPAPRASAEPTWRKPVVIENWQAKRNRGKVLPGTYSGLRFYDEIYVEWATGDKEYYDLAQDRFELDNGYSKLNEQKKADLKRQLRFSRNVEMNPIVTIIPAPVETSQIEQPEFIRGYAEDDRQLHDVQLTIENPESNSYWNGAKWVKQRIQVPARLSMTDQQATNWQFPLTEKMKVSSKLNITAIATDAAGNSSEATSQVVIARPESVPRD